jgi:DNA-binding CsgD family transcriptional regulator
VRGSRHIAQQWRDADLIQPDAGITQENPTYLTWVARGKTSAEIAQILGPSAQLIDNARTKLGAATRTQAVVKAATDRLIEP